MELSVSAPPIQGVAATATTLTISLADAALLPSITAGSGDFFSVAVVSGTVTTLPATLTSGTQHILTVTAIDKTTGLLSVIQPSALYGYINPTATISAPFTVFASTALTLPYLAPANTYVNNLAYRLTSPLLTGDLTHTVSPSAAGLFPTDVNGSWQGSSRHKKATFTLQAGSVVEVIHMIGFDPATGVMQLVRGQEGTSPVDWAVDSLLSMRITANQLQSGVVSANGAVSDPATGDVLLHITRTKQALLPTTGWAPSFSACAPVPTFNSTVNISGDVTSFGGTAVGSGAIAARESAAFGHKAKATGKRSIVISGYYGYATNDYSIAIGAYYTRAYGRGAVAVGSDHARSDGTGSVAVGYSSRATALHSIAIGDYALTPAVSSVCIGGRARTRTTGASAIAIGETTKAYGLHAVAVGAGANASAEEAVAIGYGVVADKFRTMSIGKARPVLDIVQSATGTAGAVAVYEAGALTTLTAGSSVYTGSPLGMGILLDEIVILMNGVVSAGAITPPVFTVETQAALPNVDNDIAASALTAPVVVTATAGAALIGNNTAERVTTGFDKTVPLAGVRLTLTTPPVGISGWRVALIVKGTYVPVT